MASNGSDWLVVWGKKTTGTYDVRGDLSSGTPLFMFASPMEAAAFGSLAGHVSDRPVVTYDPRGAGRNPTGTSELTPEQHEMFVAWSSLTSAQKEAISHLIDVMKRS